MTLGGNKGFIFFSIRDKMCCCRMQACKLCEFLANTLKAHGPFGQTGRDETALATDFTTVT